ncbi:timeless family protein isoform X2 [Wolffia australiana]
MRSKPPESARGEQLRAMDSEGLSSICAGLGYRREDAEGSLLEYEKGEYCLDNLKDLQRFLRRDDPHTREVFKEICKWNVVSRDLIPLMEAYQTDRSLVINGVKVLVFLTMPIDPASDNIAQQIEYLWHIKAAITRNVVVGIIVALIEDSLEHLERNVFTEDDWMLVQLVLTFFRNVLAIQDILSQHKASGSSTHFMHLRDTFLEILFKENVMDLILVLTQHLNCSSHLRQDSSLFLEIFHYIFQGQEPKLIAESSEEQPEDILIENSLNSLKDIMEEEQKKMKVIRLRNSAASSRFSGTFTRFTVDGSRTLCKANPTTSGKNFLYLPQMQRGPLKKTVWDKNFSGKRSRISSRLRNFLDQLLTGGYNVMMQSAYEDIEKDQDGFQTSEIIIFYRVACFVTNFQYHRILISTPQYSCAPGELPGEKDTKPTFHADICGPVAVTMQETMFSLVITKWRYSFETLKETSDFKMLSASSAIMKSMICLLDLVLKSSPEDSKEEKIARILLYKLFYDQTDQGATQLILNLIKSFDSHKQPRSELADLVELIYRFLKLMGILQERGSLKVSRKRRRARKKKASFRERSEEGVERQTELPEDRICSDIAFNEDVVSCPGSDPSPATDSSSLGHNKEITDVVEPNYETEVGSGDEEQQPETDEVDFRVSNVHINLANNSIIQRLCWLLKFYKTNSAAVNYYIVNLLQRISDDLELSPMLYQLSLLTTFYSILSEQKSSKGNDHAFVSDFLTKVVRRMFKKLKNQPLLFVELLFWKTRKECHYIDAESLLHDIHASRKGNENSEEATSTAEIRRQHPKSIADSLGDDEADALISHNILTQVDNVAVDRDAAETEDLHGEASPVERKRSIKKSLFQEDDQVQNPDSTRGAIGFDVAPSRKRVRAFSSEQEQMVRDLFEKFKDHRRCARMIADAMDPGAHTAAQVSRKLRQLGLRAPRPNKGPEDSDGEIVLASLLQRRRKSNKDPLPRSSPGPSLGMEEELADSGDEHSFAGQSDKAARRRFRTVLDGDADD